MTPTGLQLGKLVGGGDLLIDRESLLRQKLLVQAASGGGKSRTLRRIAEQAFGSIPTIIIDPEGEFASLRERYDYLLVSKEGGDAQVNVDTAALLARRLLETRVSAVVDLFETKGPQRHLWLARFLEAMMEAPRALWTDFLIMIDEGENYCPEKGEGESEAKSVILDVAQRGRKRGFGLVLATLRVARLDKTCLAELHNKLVGLTTMDTDLDRAANGMGIRRGKPRHDFQESLSNLDPGYFWARGPGFLPAAKTPVSVHIGDVKTTHPKPGASKQLPAPPPTARIRHLLPKFAELAAEAEKEETAKGKVERELRAEIAELERRLQDAEQAAGTAIADAAATEAMPVEVPTVPAGLPDMLQALRETAERLHADLAGAGSNAKAFVDQTQTLIDSLAGVAEMPGSIVHEPAARGQPARTFFLGDKHTEHVPKRGRGRKTVTQADLRDMTDKARQRVSDVHARRRAAGDGISEDFMEFGGHTRPSAPALNDSLIAKASGEWKIRDGVRRILGALAMTWSLDGLTARQIAAMAKLKITGGTFGTYMGELREHGCIVEHTNGHIKLSPEGKRLAGNQRRPVGGKAILEYWMTIPEIRGKCRAMLFHIVTKVGRGKYIHRDTWGEACGVAPTGGTLGTYIGLLAACGLVVQGQKSHFTPADFFYT